MTVFQRFRRRAKGYLSRKILNFTYWLLPGEMVQHKADGTVTLRTPGSEPCHGHAAKAREACDHSQGKNQNELSQEKFDIVRTASFKK